MRKVVELGRQPMGWQEILLETGAAASVPEAIIGTWSKPGTWAQVATTGHRSVVSLPSSLYLDGAATSGGATVRGRHHAGCWFDIASGAANATNERYLPEKAIKELKKTAKGRKQLAATNRKKRIDTQAKKQRSKQPPKVAKKTAKYRKGKA